MLLNAWIKTKEVWNCFVAAVPAIARHTPAQGSEAGVAMTKAAKAGS
jgi:hypothetical protein